VGLSIDSQLDLVKVYSKSEFGVDQAFGPYNSRQVAIESAKVDPQPTLSSVNDLKQRQADIIEKAKARRDSDFIYQQDNDSFIKRNSFTRDEAPSYLDVQRRNPSSSQPDFDSSAKFEQKRVQRRQDADKDIDQSSQRHNDYHKAQRAYSANQSDRQNQATVQFDA
jgi:hypothetical protein